jgi:asparagine synthase (glutamine-hydrolysing)
LTTTVLPALLRYEDRNSMAFSIETRVPFLTPGLADAAYALPAEHLIDEHATSKTVLRAALRGLVPDEILDRRDKIGFATPDSLWAPSLQGWLTDTLTSERARAIPWFDPDRALTALRARMARGGGFGFDLWRTVNIIRWMEAFDVDVA